MTHTAEAAASTDQADYSTNAIWRLVGATITAFGANEAGEIYLTTNLGDEFVIGKDDAGEIELFQIERVEVPT